ncbi:translation initiation factor IF-2 [Caldanaerobacter subterraneus]|uniref:Translation initiation factor IF-2 n=1 Tax=Caldanaerobacter subterraneus subsp. tengcongensis (strain DSM 15242 / JCM 11007 / NBRC 100824 / MB4) TaxID=273068 RepID=IF2_CALS4|nr:translation initiation factor IF-2 [Caldanaerobacter subterraneus]Q8RA37.1 RecName: Full=Translation initiation factor IF-2 [Caldanaerobacter subterraneus subsp. tengcongensis MB4]AAM24615.1 Translation initiation factor 2 (GTPase) [Caldanaerobacter subterraneus subsp. tengcongensis MB4]
MEVNNMSKTRVYELAKELNISSKDLLSKLSDLDIKVKNHMSTLEDEEVELIKDLLAEKPKEEKQKDQKNHEQEAQDKEEKEIEEDSFYEDREEKRAYKKSFKKGGKKNKKLQKKFVSEESAKEDEIKIITIPEFLTVKELAEKMKVNPTEIIKKLIAQGIMVTVNQQIDFETASKIAEEYGFLVDKEEVKDELEAIFEDTPDREEDLKPRPPIVTVMGHVDHGKTSLLDAIRKTNVTMKEMGGITQHIGASVVEINDKKVVFLDTPGHEAFTAMRARGASVTDIVVLVVAADDGVMPQTIEAINHVKAANVPLIVAINKIDLPTANPDRVKTELSELGLVPEEWGGNTICVPVSAKKNIGIDDLLEMILLVAEMEDLKANPNKPARGTVIEAKLEKGKGPVATVIVQNGTLQVGDAVIAGTTYGKVRAMFDDKGRKIKKAGPSMPVEILGFSEVPEAGDKFVVVENEKKARELAEKRREVQRELELKKKQKVSLEDLFRQIQEGTVKELNVIIKADVQGSVEALRKSLEELSNEEVRIRVIHGAVGAITETDVMLASASNAIIIGFNVRPETNAKALAEKEKVEIKLYRIIYDAIEDVKAAMKGMLEPKYKEVELGRAEVRAVFKIPGVGNVAGCYVLNGKIARNADVRIVRDGIVIYEGKIASLKRFKDDVREVQQGFECGIGIEKFNDIKEGDIIEAYTMEEIPR